MDIAKAMYLGGRIIYARDKSIDYGSYKDLGLRCYVCGEPVHFRRGEERKPHFAHFPGVDPKQVEVCELRVASYGTDTGNGEYRHIEDKGQRLKVFQSNFIQIIASTIPTFKQTVQLAKESTEYSSIAVVIPDLTRYFVNNSKSLVAHYCQLYQDKLKDITTLQKKISLEAIDFLSIKSSYYLLEEILWYICSLRKSKQLTLNARYAEVALSIIDIVINTPWIEAYSSIYRLQASWGQTTTKEPKQLIKNRRIPETAISGNIIARFNGSVLVVNAVNGNDEAIIKIWKNAKDSIKIKEPNHILSSVTYVNNISQKRLLLGYLVVVKSYHIGFYAPLLSSKKLNKALIDLTKVSVASSNTLQKELRKIHPERDKALYLLKKKVESLGLKLSPIDIDGTYDSAVAAIQTLPEYEVYSKLLNDERIAVEKYDVRFDEYQKLKAEFDRIQLPMEDIGNLLYLMPSCKLYPSIQSRPLQYDNRLNTGIHNKKWWADTIGVKVSIDTSKMTPPIVFEGFCFH